MNGGLDTLKSPPRPHRTPRPSTTVKHTHLSYTEPEGAAALWSICLHTACLSTEHEGHLVESLYSAEPIPGAPGDRAEGTEDTAIGDLGRRGWGWGRAGWSPPRSTGGRPAPRSAVFRISGKGHALRAHAKR